MKIEGEKRREKKGTKERKVREYIYIKKCQREKIKKCPRMLTDVEGVLCAMREWRERVRE